MINLQNEQISIRNTGEIHEIGQNSKISISFNRLVFPAILTESQPLDTNTHLHKVKIVIYFLHKDHIICLLKGQKYTQKENKDPGTHSRTIVLRILFIKAKTHSTKTSKKRAHS